MKFILSFLLLMNISFAKTITLKKENTIGFNRAFRGPYVASKQVEAMQKCLSNIGSDIYLVLYTPGGSISAGQLLFDTLNALPCKFHTLTIFAASMGYQTVQNLGNRYILPSGILMSHRASVSGLSGEIGGELDQLMKLIRQSVKELNQTASKRVGLSLSDYENAISDELWLTANQAVKQNHADEVVNAVCDKNLTGTYKEAINTFIGTLYIEFSECPLVVAPVSISGSKDGVKYYNDFYSNTKKFIKTEL